MSDTTHSTDSDRLIPENFSFSPAACAQECIVLYQIAQELRERLREIPKIVAKVDTLYAETVELHAQIHSLANKALRLGAKMHLDGEYIITGFTRREVEDHKVSAPPPKS